MRCTHLAGLLCLFIGLSIQADPSSPTSKPSTTPPGFLDEKYDSGQLKSHYAIDAKGIKSGSYTLYAEDGKRIERGTYKNGDLDGARQTFYPNGNAKLQESYRKGRLDGPLTEFDEKGNPIRSARFNNGVPLEDRTMIDGLLVYPRSAAMISAELDRIRQTKIETLRAATPIPSHEGTNDSEKDREDAVRRLMEYRYLSYVPYSGMALDPVFDAHDEAAAAILAKIGKLDHTPANPGWPEDRYKFAYKGTSSSNIFQSGGAAQCVNSVNAYMDDSDSSNIDRLGHRRWCLNPRMGKVGFGSCQGFSAMWSMDTSRKDVPSFDFIAYPGPGVYPSTHFGDRHAWSISVNELKYGKPPAKGLKVTIVPIEIQRDKNKIAPAGKPFDLDYDAVDLAGYGIPNCIIFRPAGLKLTPGQAYLVDVAGLKSNNGRPGVLRYVVEFYNPEESKPN